VQAAGPSIPLATQSAVLTSSSALLSEEIEMKIEEGKKETKTVHICFLWISFTPLPPSASFAPPPLAPLVPYRALSFSGGYVSHRETKKEKKKTFGSDSSPGGSKSASLDSRKAYRIFNWHPKQPLLLHAVSSYCAL